MNESEMVRFMHVAVCCFFPSISSFFPISFGWHSEWKIALDTLDWCTTLCPFIDKCQSTLVFKKKNTAQPFSYFWVLVRHFDFMTELKCAKTSNVNYLIRTTEYIQLVYRICGQLKKFPIFFFSRIDPVVPFQMK